MFVGIVGTEGELWEVHRRFLLRQLRDFGFGKSTMEQLVLDADKRKKLGENAYENIEQNYNADKQAYKWAEAYEAVLKKDLTLLEV